MNDGLECKLLYKFKDCGEFNTVKNGVFECIVNRQVLPSEYLHSVGINDTRDMVDFRNIRGKISEKYMFIQDGAKDIALINEYGYYSITLGYNSSIYGIGDNFICYESKVYKRTDFEQNIVPHLSIFKYIILG